ncbi:hypothetical protein BGX28_000293, partial [Mortierella sp. GBA30]
ATRSRKAVSSKTSELSLGVDIMRPKSLIRARKSRQKRDNIENVQPTTSATQSLANIPVQKQYTKVRKRILTEQQINTPLDIRDIRDQHPSKRHRCLGDTPTSSARLTHPLTTHVPPLQPTLARKKKRSRQNRAEAQVESDDADDEEELPLKESTAASKNGCPRSTGPVTDRSNPERIKTGPRLGVFEASNKPQYPPVENQHHYSYEDELAGSDTTITLTCPEDEYGDNSEDDKLDIAQSAKSTPPSETCHSSKTQGSLMARVLEGANQPLRVDSDSNEANTAADISAESDSESWGTLRKGASQGMDKVCAHSGQLNIASNPGP